MLAKTIRIFDLDKNEVAVAERTFYAIQPKYGLNGMGWEIQPKLMRHEYKIRSNGCPVMTGSRESFNGCLGCQLDIADGADVLAALAAAAAIAYGS